MLVILLTEPTESDTPTKTPTQAVTAPTEVSTDTSTEATISSATSNNSSTGKFPTGDSASVVILSFIMLVAGAVIVT
ncbi:MAG: hypothetical protein UH241_01855 [Acutalibacteraceae bacterium]|nr:hypothetical protein [Acutalibacteraceae bacterium]